MILILSFFDEHFFRWNRLITSRVIVLAGQVWIDLLSSLNYYRWVKKVYKHYYSAFEWNISRVCLLHIFYGRSQIKISSFSIYRINFVFRYIDVSTKDLDRFMDDLKRFLGYLVIERQMYRYIERLNLLDISIKHRNPSNFHQRFPFSQ